MTARQRIVAGTAATLTWQAVDQDGEPADPGTTTVAVAGSARTVVLAAGTATTVSGTARTVAIAAQSLDQLTVTWTGATATATATVDVVGGVYFTTAQLRADQTSVIDTVRFTTAEIVEARTITETIFEQRTRTAFVPRFAVLTSTRGSKIARTGIRAVRWVQTVDDTYYTTAADIEDLVTITQAGLDCAQSVERVGLSYGFDACPADVRKAAMLYTRHILAEAAASGIDMRAIATSAPDGQAFGAVTPNRANAVTGIESVDEVLRAYYYRAAVRSVRTGGY